MQFHRSSSKGRQASAAESSWAQADELGQYEFNTPAHQQHSSLGDIGLHQMWLPRIPQRDGRADERAYQPKWRSNEMTRQESDSDYPESSYLSSRSNSSQSQASSANSHQFVPSIPYHQERNGHSNINAVNYANTDQHKPSLRVKSAFRQELAPEESSERQKPISYGMKADQRRHSVTSNASTSVSINSHSSVSSNHSRLTSKFPVPRLVCSGTKASSTGNEGRWSTKLLLSRPEAASVRADVAAHIAQQDARERKARWTKAKWLLLLSVAAMFSYGLAGLLLGLLTWFRTWSTADVLIVAENEILIYITLASAMCIVTALVGLVGTMLNSRPILAVYNLLLWPTLAAILVIGYTSYRKQALNLDRKLNQAWSQFFNDAARLRLQNTLHCCGYYSPLHQATFSKRCYPRTALPGCKGKLFRFEKDMLHQIAMATFAIVPVHLFNIFIALLCSNHVNRTFGKGLMPRQYRLSIMDVRENAILALRALPTKPEEVKTAVTRADVGKNTDRQKGMDALSGSDAGKSISTGIRMVPHQQEWARLRHHGGVGGGAAAGQRRSPPSSSPAESLRTLPRYNGNLKGLGLF
ncbi:hypothetical protein P389DRAFT_161158 [Cystobasidium minutum MCA 4210]|uniref:uncharacterized protein n=1 Tax=Cystobasidium minutum MCA 4210 TaxID=1397322 RepID=UPI0034CE31F1|eukprot:jgi/Rhomi1/161158/estExt_Genewise1Plus.C_4_t30179